MFVQRGHGEAFQLLLAAGALVPLVGGLGILELVVEVVGTAEPVPRFRRDGWILGGELQVADGLVLVLAAEQQAGAETEVEDPIAGCEADELAVERKCVHVVLLVEEPIGFRTDLLVTLGRGCKGEHQENNYAR